ncbi:MAG: phosphoenolpyruvate carboxykinase (ATP), partial [Phycisphaerales bacterium JB059]
MPTVSANSLDLSPSRAMTNLSTAELIERALARGEGRFADNGALVVMTGERTGRSPTDKWLEDTPGIHDNIWWGKVNQPITPDQFDTALRMATEYMNGLDEVFVFDGFAGADTAHRLGVRVVTELAWHALFAETLF